MSRFVFACMCFVLGASLVIGDESPPNGAPKEEKIGKGKGKGEKGGKAAPASGQGLASAMKVEKAPRTPDARDLKDTVEAFTAAIAKKNTDAAANYVGADFTWVTDSGEVLDLSQWALRVKDNRVVRVPQVTVPSIKEFGVIFQHPPKVVGGAGIAVGTWVVIDHSGATVRVRFTLTCAAVGGAWKILAVQVAEIR